MKVIVFDTETTGIPNQQLSIEKQPHVCQFASLLLECDLEKNDLQELNRVDLMIKPPVSIPQECSYVHGITDEMVADKPSFGDLVDKIMEEFRKADVAVAHNLRFDQVVLEYELQRLGLSKDFLPEQTFDTMSETKELCKIPGRHGKLKSPKLMELYQFLFNKKFDRAHNAIHDVIATADCLDELLKRGVFQPEEPLQGALF